MDVFISEEALADLLSDLIRLAIPGLSDLKVEVTTRADELLDLAKERAFDLFFLFLNNINFPGRNLPAEKRIRRALSLVIQLKARYRRPIICLYGWPKDPSYGRQALLAGADFAFQTPFEPPAMIKAIDACLKETRHTGP